MISCKVASNEVRVLEGVSKGSGKPYKLRFQTVLVKLGEEVRNIDLNIGENPPYAPGLYQVNPLDILTFGRFGLEVKRDIDLKPVK